MKEMRRMVQLLKVLTASVLIIMGSLSEKKIGLKVAFSLFLLFQRERE